MKKEEENEKLPVRETDTTKTRIALFSMKYF